MTTRIGINGFGRIGRQVLKAIRDLYPGTVEVGEDALIVDGRPIKVFKETDPGKLPWADLGVEIVIESTGLFTIKKDGINKKGKEVKGAENHITKGGAKKVII